MFKLLDFHSKKIFVLRCRAIMFYKMINNNSVSTGLILLTPTACSYINTRENWKNSKLCENNVSTQFLVFPISTRVDITVYQHGKCFIFLKYHAKTKFNNCFITYLKCSKVANTFRTSIFNS